MPLITLFLADLAMELALPPTLEEFQATIAMHHWSASSPIIWPKGGRQRYGICPRVSSALVTPEWMKWGWLYPKSKDPEAEVTLDGLRPLILLEVI